MPATATAMQFDLFSGAPCRGMGVVLVPTGADPQEMERRGDRVRVEAQRRSRALSECSLAAHAHHAAALAGRKALIVDCIRLAHEPLTDRQIKDRIFGEGGDMNLVRPRITELIRERRLIECGEIVDSATGDTVRKVWLA